MESLDIGLGLAGSEQLNARSVARLDTAHACRSSGVTEHKKPQGHSFKSRKSTHQLAEETRESEEVDVVEDGIDCGNYSQNNIYLVSSKTPSVWVLVYINGVAVKMELDTGASISLTMITRGEINYSKYH